MTTLQAILSTLALLATLGIIRICARCEPEED